MGGDRVWWERAGSNPQRAFLRKDIFGTSVLPWLTPRAAERDLPRGPMEQPALPSWAPWELTASYMEKWSRVSTSSGFWQRECLSNMHEET